MRIKHIVVEPADDSMMINCVFSEEGVEIDEALAYLRKELLALEPKDEENQKEKEVPKSRP